MKKILYQFLTLGMIFSLKGLSNIQYFKSAILDKNEDLASVIYSILEMKFKSSSLELFQETFGGKMPKPMGGGVSSELLKAASKQFQDAAAAAGTDKAKTVEVLPKLFKEKGMSGELVLEAAKTEAGKADPTLKKAIKTALENAANEIMDAANTIIIK